MDDIIPGALINDDQRAVSDPENHAHLSQPRSSQRNKVSTKKVLTGLQNHAQFVTFYNEIRKRSNLVFRRYQTDNLVKVFYIGLNLN